MTIITVMGNSKLNSRIASTADAVRVAENRLEYYRQMNSYSALQSSGVPRTVNTTDTRNGITYNVVTTICPSDTPANLPCTPTAVYIRVRVSQNGQLLQNTETFFSKFGASSE